MRSRLLAALALPVLLAACGTSGASDSAPGPVAGSAEVTDCGRTVRTDGPPRRIVSFFPSNTELLLALGLKDRIAGQVWADQSPPKPAFATAYRSLKVLSPGEVSKETLLAARPDFILADGEYNFDGRKLPTIKELAALGVPVYVNAAFCPAATGSATLADTGRDLAALGKLLGVPDAARRSKATADATLADVRARVAGRAPVRTAMVQIFDKQLFALAGGLYSDIVRTAGGTNVLDGAVPRGKNFDAVSVEAVAKADPDTIVYHYTGEDDRRATEKWLRANLGRTRAVERGRLIATPAADFSGLRAVDGTLTLARAMHPTAF